MSIILGVAEGEVFANDAEIQKSALQVRSCFEWFAFKESAVLPTLVNCRKTFVNKYADSVRKEQDFVYCLSVLILFEHHVSRLQVPDINSTFMKHQRVMMR